VRILNRLIPLRSSTVLHDIGILNSAELGNKGLESTSKSWVPGYWNAVRNVLEEDTRCPPPMTSDKRNLEEWIASVLSLARCDLAPKRYDDRTYYAERFTTRILFFVVRECHCSFPYWACRLSISFYFEFPVLMDPTHSGGLSLKLLNWGCNNSHTYTSRAWRVHGSTRTTKE
jgi:hypothetical protein